MYRALVTKPGCASAWVEAALAISPSIDEYNVIIDIENPNLHTPLDNEVISLVDTFLRERGQNPVNTVANTIFPQSLYRQHDVRRNWCQFIFRSPFSSADQGEVSWLSSFEYF